MTERESREGTRVWDAFQAHLGPSPWEHPLTVMALPSIVLFLEAANSYDAGLGIGTSVLCRAALESAFYGVLYRRRMARDTWLPQPPLTQNGEVRKVYFKEIKDAITKKPILDEKQIKAWERINIHGNEASHFAARLDRALFGRDSKNRNWFEPGEVLQDLEDTSDILKRLADYVRDDAPPNHMR